MRNIRLNLFCGCRNFYCFYTIACNESVKFRYLENAIACNESVKFPYLEHALCIRRDQSNSVFYETSINTDHRSCRHFQIFLI